MLNLDKTVDLPPERVKALTDIIEDHREELKKEGLFINMIVRGDIFDILAHYCTVIYFPLPAEENDGFHISVPVDYKPGGASEQFVYLNTAKPLEKQVFAAAHELGHIWVQKKLPWADEAAMNRFAAELLMPKEIFRQAAGEQLKKHTTPDGVIALTDVFRVIASLMDAFCVPAQAVICRFYETELMTKDTCKYLLSGPENKLGAEAYQDFFDSTLRACVKEGGYTNLLKSTGKKGIKDFPEVLSKIEGKGIYSESRIANLRTILGIPKIETKQETIDLKETK